MMTHINNKPIVLVDMDGVLCDLEQALYKRVLARNDPDMPAIKPEDRNTFSASDQYANECNVDKKKAKAIIWSIMQNEGFFADLPEIDGAIYFVKEMAKAGIDVRFCTSPVHKPAWSAKEKYDWIAKHFNTEWARKVTIAPDKTLVRGDLLIDDKANIKGTLTPEWRQILFHSPSNDSEYYQRPAQLRLYNWASWTIPVISSLGTLGYKL